ncbi:MAG: endonuclease/exonuclease/phosphatase family protein [Bacteroidota bacterium]
MNELSFLINNGHSRVQKHNMRNLKRFHVLMILMVIAQTSKSQNLKDLSFGTDSTLEVVTWNIENFPKEGQATIEYVTDIIYTLDADVIALQEISETDEFNALLDNLDGYEGYIASGSYTDLAYIYKSETVEINEIYEIFAASTYWAPFPRPPLVIDFNFKNRNYIVINNHLKCCGDGEMVIDDPEDEETRRYRANLLIRQYINEYFPDKSVFIVGDMNDEITDIDENNVFSIILNDTENFLFADLEIAYGNSTNWSYPSWPSHLDHIIITNELFPALENEGSETEVLKVEELLSGGWWSYENNVSDHRPVAIRLLIPSDMGVESPVTSRVPLSCHPNPFAEATIFSFPPFSGTAQLNICNNQGKLVYSGTLTGPQVTLDWNATAMPDGIYFARMIQNGYTTATAKLIVAR